MDRIYPFLLLSFVIILPLIPSYILYKNLPSRAFLTGPLKGFNVKLSGAFAGYFALVLLVLLYHSIWNPPPTSPPRFEEWSVLGKISYPGNPEELMARARIMTVPPIVSFTRDGAFLVKFSKEVSESNFPELDIDLEGFQLVKIPLDGRKLPYEDLTPPVSVNAIRKEIDVKDPIVLIRTQLGTTVPGAAYNEHSAQQPQRAKEQIP